MPKKRKRIICCSDDEDDEDEFPLIGLKKINNYSNDPNSYNSLCIPSSQPCEICEKVSKNRYSSLIHNVKHIIIPLINQTVHQCDICLHYFTSTNDLDDHKSKKHSIFVKTNSGNKSSNLCADQSYKSIVVKKEKFETYSAMQVEDEDLERCSNRILIGGSSIKSRLMFEEDLIESNSDKLLDDFTKDCYVNVELFPPIWDIEYPQSIHYDQLVNPGVFKCKKCMQMFPNRYDMIIHESKHIVIANSQVNLCNICNTYIIGDNKKLKHHKLMSHTKMAQKFDHKDVIISEGRIEIHNGVELNVGNLEKQNGYSKSFTTKVVTMKLCDVCLTFSKNSKTWRNNYDCIGELSDIGKKYTCDKCGYMFFCVQLVKRETKYKFSSFSKNKNKSNKGMSNEERLKVISKRFRILKKS